MNRKQLQHVAKKVLNGTATEAEIRFLESYYGVFESAPGRSDELTEAEKEQLSQQIRAAISKRMQRKPFFHALRPWMKYAAAAIFILASATALYFYPSLTVKRKSENLPAAGAIVKEIKPGGNRATLTFADGTKVILDSTQSGIIVNNTNIKYTNGSEIGAKESPHAPSTYHIPLSTYNSISTPKGGQYQIMLEDGTKIWLNAASTLKYLSKFTGDKREVELEGEAYFQVAKSKNLNAGPAFIVKTRNQAISVLGTTFNVSAYQEDPSITTTLIEGAVRVQTIGYQPAQSLLLKANEKAVFQAGRLEKSKADADTEAAWKAGYFAFNNEALPGILRKIARWYNVEIEYRTDVSGVSLLGLIPRSSQLAATLERLQKTSGIHFKIEERRVVVMQ